jgi:GcrA cell cycle regulator
MTTVVQSGWTDERIERLTALWAEGKSASEIATAMGGTSRAAVIGKARRIALPMRGKAVVTELMHRMRHPGRKLGAGALQKAREAKPKPEKVRRVIHAPSVISKTRLKPMPPNKDGKLIDVTKAKVWTERKFGECAYPVSGEGAEMLSCCMATEGATYCAGHARIMFVPAQRRAATEPSRRRRAA